MLPSFSSCLCALDVFSALQLPIFVCLSMYFCLPMFSCICMLCDQYSIYCGFLFLICLLSPMLIAFFSCPMFISTYQLFHVLNFVDYSILVFLSCLTIYLCICYLPSQIFAQMDPLPILDNDQYVQQCLSKYHTYHFENVPGFVSYLLLCLAIFPVSLSFVLLLILSYFSHRPNNNFQFCSIQTFMITCLLLSVSWILWGIRLLFQPRNLRAEFTLVMVPPVQGRSIISLVVARLLSVSLMVLLSTCMLGIGWEGKLRIHLLLDDLALVRLALGCLLVMIRVTCPFH